MPLIPFLRVPVPRHACLGLILALAAGLFSPWARADEYAEVQRLIREGRLAEAQQRVDRQLSARPRDPQWRLAKGVIQRESGRLSEALNTFIRLSEDHPQLPEPYNNLAAVYAAQGQYDKARDALEKALRTHPAYATAHDNLTELYARQAAQAYGKALQVDAPAPPPLKLTLLHELHPAAAPPAATSTATAAVPAAPAAPSKGSPPASTPATAVAAAATVPPKPAASAPARPAERPAASAAATAAAAQPTTPVAPAINPEAARNAVEQAVRAWAQAWSERDVARYLAAYGPDFETPGRIPRRAWEEERRARILNKSRIKVTLLNLQISVSGERAVAKFRQDYKADTLSVQSRKTLELVRAGERWLIVRESSGG
jgi:tetratricopeptide (TPR) repeat protein